MNQFFNVIGTMSGTSFDGVDISLAKTNGDDHFEILYNLYEPFNKETQDNLKLLKFKINKSPQDLLDKTEKVELIQRLISDERENLEKGDF